MNENVIEIDVAQFYEPLLKLDANSEAAFVAKAAHLSSADKLVNCRECLTRAIALNAQSFCAWCLLGQVYRKLYCWEEAERASSRALRSANARLKDQLLRRRIELTLVEALSRSNDRQKLMQARQMCEEVGIIAIAWS